MTRPSTSQVPRSPQPGWRMRTRVPDVRTRRRTRMAGDLLSRAGLQAVLGAELLGLGAAGGGLLREPGGGGLGAQAVVAAPGAVVGGLVVVVGVGAAVAAAGAAVGAGAAAAGVWRRPMRPSALPCTTGLFAGAAGGFLLGPAAGLLLAAFAGAVGGLLAGGRAEPPFAAGVIGLLEGGAAVGAGGADHADGGGHRFVTSKANRWPRPRPGPGGVRVGGSLRAQDAQQLVGAPLADAGAAVAVWCGAVACRRGATWEGRRRSSGGRAIRRGGGRSAAGIRSASRAVGRRGRGRGGAVVVR